MGETLHPNPPLPHVWSQDGVTCIRCDVVDQALNENTPCTMHPDYSEVYPSEES